MAVTATLSLHDALPISDTLPTFGNLTSWVIPAGGDPSGTCAITGGTGLKCSRSEEHTPELQTPDDDVSPALHEKECTLITNTATVTGDNVLTKTATGDQ